MGVDTGTDGGRGIQGNIFVLQETIMTYEIREKWKEHTRNNTQRDRFLQPYLKPHSQINHLNYTKMVLI